MIYWTGEWCPKCRREHQTLRLFRLVGEVTWLLRLANWIWPKGTCDIGSMPHPRWRCCRNWRRH